MSDAVTHLNAALEGRYAIGRELSEGGMATVYMAELLRRSGSWRVSDPSVARVGPDGVVGRVGEGTVEIIARAEKAEGTASAPTPRVPRRSGHRERLRSGPRRKP